MSRRLALVGALAVTTCTHPHHHTTPNLIAAADRTTTTTTTVSSTVPPAAPRRATSPHASRNAARPRTPATTGPNPGAGSTNVWDRLAVCESGNRNDHNPPYYGYWQFDDRTFHGLGYRGHASDYSRETQLAAAQRLQSLRGWAPWPGCARKLGLAA